MAGLKMSKSVSQAFPVSLDHLHTLKLNFREVRIEWKDKKKIYRTSIVSKMGDILKTRIEEEAGELDPPDYITHYLLFKFLQTRG